MPYNTPVNGGECEENNFKINAVAVTNNSTNNGEPDNAVLRGNRGGIDRAAVKRR